MKSLEEILKEISKENIIDEMKNALRKKDLDTYNKWEEDKFNINHIFYGQDTLLHFAAEDDTMEIAKALIKNGANVNVVGRFGTTPLHHAARFGEVEVMKILIENGANVNAADKAGNTPLHRAIEEAPCYLKVGIIKALIENGADINAVNKCGENTPLHSTASFNDSVDVVRILIENKANVNVVDNLGNTPLHLATQEGCVSIVQILIENGANINAINEYDEDTPLHLAAHNNNLEIVKYMIDKGADINAKNIKHKVPLDCAKEKGYEEIVEYLMDKMAMPPKENKALPVYQNEDFDNDVFLSDYHASREKKVNEEKKGKAPKEKGGCLIQSHQRQKKKFIFHYLLDIEIKPVRQGIYLPSFEVRGVKIDGKCVAITRGLTQALFLQSERSFLGNLETSAGIYERIAQGKQISKREEKEVFAFSELLNNFERQIYSATNSLPSRLIYNKSYKTLDDLSHYMAKVEGDFAVHLVTSNHVVAVYRTGDNYTYFDSNAAFVSGLKSVDHLTEVIKKGACYKAEEKGFLVEHFDVEQANKLLSSGDRQVLAKEIKTERQLLAEQDKDLGLIKINGQKLSRVQLYDFGTKINVEGSILLLINADMNLSSEKFQDRLNKKEVSMTAREYLDSLKNSKDMEGVVQATKAIPFIGCKREIEEAEQTRKPLLELIKGTINFILTTASLTSAKSIKKSVAKKGRR